MYYLFFSFVAAALPFFILPLEQYFPYPAIIEEMVKYVAIVVVRCCIQKQKYSVVITSLLFGTIFALSESLFYVAYFLQVKNGIYEFILRIVLTGILHSVTFSLLFYFRRWNILLGLGINIFIHFLFNLYIGGNFN